MQSVVSTSDLPLLVGPRGPVAGRHLLEGAVFGLCNLTLVLGETAPGVTGLFHRHEYEEIFVVHSGRGTYYVGDEVIEAGPGDVIMVPSGIRHKFANPTQEPLYHTSIHSTGTFAMDLLEQ